MCATMKPSPHDISISTIGSSLLTSRRYASHPAAPPSPANTAVNAVAAAVIQSLKFADNWPDFHRKRVIDQSSSGMILTPAHPPRSAPPWQPVPGLPCPAHGSSTPPQPAPGSRCSACGATPPPRSSAGHTRLPGRGSGCCARRHSRACGNRPPAPGRHNLARFRFTIQPTRMDRMQSEPLRLWTPDDLAAFLGMSPRTIVTMCSRAPDRLPPRVQAVTAPRWVPSVCQAWAEKQSGIKRKGGRPRTN